MEKLLYIQPILPKYRQHVLDGLNDKFKLKVIASEKSENGGFDYCETKKINFIPNKTKRTIFGINYSTKIISHIIKDRPDIILSHMDMKNMTCWAAMIISKLIGIKYYSYGHGLYKKKNHLVFYKLIFKLIAKLNTKYICYNKYVENDLFDKINSKNLRHINNTIIFKDHVEPFIKSSEETSLLYIGRIRDSSNIEKLIDACIDLSQKNKIKLHIIGDGDLNEKVKSKISNIDFIYLHGKIFDEEKIISIAKNCNFGCYPGDAGLSVVHYMSLSLPTIIHSDISSHMGPEPSYINDMQNGITFERGDYESLKCAIIKSTKITKENLYKMSKSSFDKYIELSSQNFSDQFLKITKEND